MKRGGDMGNGLKSKLTGWGATVGLAALSLLGNVGVQQTGNNSVETVTKSATARDLNTIGSAAVPVDGSYQVSQSSPPPPPPPPAVGAVRG